MKFLADDRATTPKAPTRHIRLFSTSGEMHVGAAVFDYFRRLRVAPTDAAWDFASVSFAAITADRASSRSGSADGWTREIELTVAVSDPARWTAMARDVASLLQFLTTDRWEIDFVGRASNYPTIEALPLTSESGCLLSGGLDSLVGAFDAGSTGQHPVLVSQTVRGDRKRQQTFARAASAGSTHVQIAPAPHTPGSPENSQRSRSLGFFALGALAMSATLAQVNGGRSSLLLPENGYIAINPPLTSGRIGSLSTRTAHPTTLGRVQRVLDQAGIDVVLENPYAFVTKGEMLVDARRHDGFSELSVESTSCGRFLHFGYRHCGRCLPCQIRRAAFLRAVIEDTTDYVYSDLSRADADHAWYPDVRDVGEAIERRSAMSIERWAGAALASPFVDDSSRYYLMLDRGLSELEELHRSLGVR